MSDVGELARITRGLFLTMLAAVWPKAKMEAQLKAAIAAFGDISPAAWEGNLQYLERKGYIELRAEVQISGRNNAAYRSWQITPKGLDLIDASIDPDPGITLPPSEAS